MPVLSSVPAVCSMPDMVSLSLPHFLVNFSKNKYFPEWSCALIVASQEKIHKGLKHSWWGGLWEVFDMVQCLKHRFLMMENINIVYFLSLLGCMKIEIFPVKSQKQVEKENFLKCSCFRKKESEKCTHSKWTQTAIIVKQKSSQINTQKFFISAEISEDL